MRLELGLPTLSAQVITGIATDDFWLGSLGLSPVSMNFTGFNAPVPSLVGNLTKNKIIPSASWAYTAGASYRNPPALGSLTLGGYDQTQSVPNNLSFGFGAADNRDLLVGVQSISYDTLGSTPLMAEGQYMFIDSMVTHLWLPMPVCQAFEQAFTLTWNETAELYVIDDNTHTALLAQNPMFRFSIGKCCPTSRLSRCPPPLTA